MLTRVDAWRGIVAPRLRPARAHLRRGFVTPPTYISRRNPPSHWRRGSAQTGVDPGATKPRHAMTRVSISGLRARFFTFSVLACLIPEVFYMGRILSPRLSNSGVILYGIDPISVKIRFSVLDRSDSQSSGFLFSCRAHSQNKLKNINEYHFSLTRITHKIVHFFPIRSKLSRFNESI